MILQHPLVLIGVIIYTLSYGALMFFRIRKGLHMLQQNGYSNGKMLKNFIDPKFDEDVITYPALLSHAVLIFGLLVFFKLLYIYLFAASAVFILQIVFFRLRESRYRVKKPLVYTKRVMRLVYTLLLLIALYGVGTFFIALLFFHKSVAFLASGACIVFFLLYYILLLANMCNKPLEHKITEWYKNDARTILAKHTNLKTIGITGSYGKTSTKHIVGAVLSEEANTLITPASYNTPSGLTITVREFLRPIHSYFVAEMGAYKEGEIKELCDLVSPEVGILTSIGPQHLETFKTIETVQKTKFELIESLPQTGLAVLNMDDDNIRSYTVKNNVSIITYAIHKEADVRASNITYSKEGVSFDVRFKDGSLQHFTSKLLGEHNIYNILAAVIVAEHYGVSKESMERAVRKLRPIEHRLEMKKQGAITIIDDAFNSNPVGSKMAIDVMGHMPGQKIIITPGMIELGSEQYERNKAFGKYMAEVLDDIILVGKKQTEPIVDGIEETDFPKEHLYVVDTIYDAFEQMRAIASEGAYVLLENDLPDVFNE